MLSNWTVSVTAKAQVIIACLALCLDVSIAVSVSQNECPNDNMFEALIAYHPYEVNWSLLLR